MGTERELLEFAAKAAGIVIGSPEDAGGFNVLDYNERDRSYGPRRVWNPFTNDADAFRLAVKLRLHVDHHANSVEVWILDGTGARSFEEDSIDAFAATRRAIVRAAAAIGAAS